MISPSRNNNTNNNNRSNNNNNDSNNNNSTGMIILSFVLGASCTLAWTYYLNTNYNKLKQQSRRRQRRTSSSHQQQQDPSSSSSNSNNSTIIPQNLRQEQLSRHELYFGSIGLNSIESSKVCIVGLGGVGSHTAIMLARGGIYNYLRLIDFDQVTLSSLNRHACATLDDVGIPKVTCVKNTCLKLGLPSQNIDTKVEMYTESNGPSLLSLPSPSSEEEEDNNNNNKWDLIIDCIDDVPTKASLLAYCLSNKIKVLSCMGAGGKSDMTRLHISDLRTAAKDPLATKLRQTLKKTLKRYDTDNNVDDSYLDDMDQLTIIYSSEKPVVKLADLTEEQKSETNKAQTFGNVDGMRIRVLPVLGPMPAIMGQSLASLALCELGLKPIHQPVTGERISRNVRNKLYQHLKNREKKITSGQIQLQLHDDRVLLKAPENEPVGSCSLLEIDTDDVDYLMGIWRNRCAVTGARLGTVLSLTRWDYSKPATIDNLVLMSTHALQAYDEKGRNGSIPSNIQKRIEQRLATCRDLNCDY